MTTSMVDLAADDLLAGWVAQRQRVAARIRGRRRITPTTGGLRFAFYGRVSTEDFQDPISSRRWQYDCADELVAGHGAIVAEFFDIGQSRRKAWVDRPQAAALLTAIADPQRGFDAIVVGEYERAFHGSQLALLVPLLARHGVQLWLPELDGPVDPANPTHQAVLTLLGGQAKREVARSRFRTLAAMRAQTELQGRHLGGRPPYGYRLADAGPHPNRVHASWGRRLHRLEPHPTNADHVKWIFAQRLAGHSTASIARTLNERGVPCPSAADPDRNRHRSGNAWTLRTVAAILSNPRYTGRQVWNRQRTDREPRDPIDGLLGHDEVRRWNPTSQWVISTNVAHTPLVSEADFIAVQKITAVPTPEDGSTRSYRLVGLLICRLCARRMDAHWLHSRPGYRCRHGHTSAKTATPDRPGNLYLREDHIVARIAAQLHDIDKHDIAVYLRDHDMTVICDADRCEIVIATESGPALLPYPRSPIGRT